VIDVLKLHLDAAEEEAFISYLTVSLKELGLEQLVHYFLQRGRYNEVAHERSLLSRFLLTWLTTGHAGVQGSHFATFPGQARIP